MDSKKKTPKRWIACLLLCFGPVAQGQTLDWIDISEKVAASLSLIDNPAYETIAFSRIKGKPQKTVERLIDYANVNLVKQRRFSVTDRTRLEQILKEQRYNLSELVSPDSYKQIGKLLGVDLFVYGSFYENELILKAIDVATSRLVWSDIFSPETAQRGNGPLYERLAGLFVNSVREQSDTVKAFSQLISFWSLETSLDEERLIDHLTYALLQDGNFKVVDRANLQIILEEQKLNLESFFDPATAKRMGKLYGVDNFIYGSILREKGSWISSLKMMNINSGVIVWADLLQTDDQPALPLAEDAEENRRQNDMVRIDGGSYVIGHDNDRLASPRHEVSVRAFEVERYEVSNRDYYDFIRRYKHRPPRHWLNGRPAPGTEELPVVLINWNDAEKYCRSNRKRLLLESEWEIAFRGRDERLYPWARRQFKKEWTNTAELELRKPVAVSSETVDQTEKGVRFMAGNVREWVGSKLRRYPSNRFGNSMYDTHRVIRGSSWAQKSSKAVGWFRDASLPDFGYKDVGFRCARYAD